MDDIIKLISTVGFPIVMCLLQWYDKRTAFDNNTKAITKIETTLSHLESSIKQNNALLLEMLKALSSYSPKED